VTNCHDISDRNDPRLEPFRDLPQRGIDITSQRFVVEGELLTRRLLTSPLIAESILITPSRLERLRPVLPDHVPVYVAPNELLRTVVGYPFHAGVLACSRRPPNPSLEACSAAGKNAMLVVCPRIDNHANLGSLIRVAAAMGAAAMLLGHSGCDPFRRQAIRVSMGSVLTLPVRRCDDIHGELEALTDRWGFHLVAAVLAPDAPPLHAAHRARPLAVMMGNEADGLDPALIARAHQRVRIPMHADTDSLNVAVAAAVMLYHFSLPG